MHGFSEPCTFVTFSFDFWGLDSPVCFSAGRVFCLHIYSQMFANAGVFCLPLRHGKKRKSQQNSHYKNGVAVFVGVLALNLSFFMAGNLRLSFLWCCGVIVFTKIDTMETFDEQMKKCDAIAAKLASQSGFPFSGNDIWRTCYGMNNLHASAKLASIGLKELRKAMIGRDGTRQRPLRFGDIAKRIK